MDQFHIFLIEISLFFSTMGVFKRVTQVTWAPDFYEALDQNID